LTEIVGTATTDKFSSQLTAFGINPSKIHRNLTVEQMVSYAVERKEGVVNSTGSLSVNTGKYTGRSPDDRFIVYDDKTHDAIDWGKINHQFPSGKFEKILENILAALLMIDLLYMMIKLMMPLTGEKSITNSQVVSLRKFLKK